MRIAITGMGGYVGGWLHETLTRRGHQVTGQDIEPPSPVSRYTCFNLGSDGLRRAWLDAGDLDLVIHLAAVYGRVWGEINLMKTAAINAGLTAVLARDVAKRGIRLMYVSSSEVYGAAADGPAPLAEDAALAPLNMYGLSKKWGEEAARVYAPDGLTVIRLSMPYGPPLILPDRADPHFSARVGVTGFNALHTMLWQAYHGLPITVHQGTERAYTWAGDAMDGIALIAESGEAGTWNVTRGSADLVSSADLAARCVELAGSRSQIRMVDMPAQVTRRKDLHAGKLEALGWQPAVPLETGMPKTLDYVSCFDADGRWQG
jgi:nucleoside-diphosphate-sugar epimerase